MNTLALTKAEEYVTRGVAFLDENVPGWENRIVLPQFRMSDGCKCVLGFVYAEDAKSFLNTDGFDYADRKFGGGSGIGYWAEHNGFDYTPNEASYDELQEEWTKVITDRLSAV